MPKTKTIREFEVTVKFKELLYDDNKFYSFSTSAQEGDIIPLRGTAATIAEALIAINNAIVDAERLKKGKNVIDPNVDSVIQEQEVFEEVDELQMLKDYLVTMVKHRDDPGSVTNEKEDAEIERVKAQIAELEK